MNNTIFSPEFITTLNYLISHRRSVKPERFSDKTIDRELLMQLLENANWAPTHGLNEPWRFKIFEGEGRHRLAKFQADWYVNNTPAALFSETKHRQLAERPLLASHIIAICLNRKSETAIPLVEDVEAVACAMQNLHLSAIAYGLAGYWNSGGATYTDEMKTFLGIAPTDECLGFFYLGYPKENHLSKGNRQPVSEKITWITTS